MTLEDWSTQLKKILESDEGLPHASNLIRKITLAQSERSFIGALKLIVPAYFKLYDKYTNTSDLKEWVNALNKYINTIRSDACKIFSHQSDFISSVVPEFFYMLFKCINKDLELSYTAMSQKDIIIHCNFDPKIENGISFEKKRVDVVMAQESKFSFNDVDYPEFFIPILVVEVKTNMDKNMISGIENSVESLKRTFPRCMYFAVCEWADFAIEKQNYANTFIDEIFVLRKQKRSDFRNEGKINEINIEILQRFEDKVKKHFQELQNQTSSIKDRMKRGSLIKR